MRAYYNEFDRHAAEWLRCLIREGLIAPGDVDERSIRDVQPDDLRGYTQCHFFAGIGGWSYALRLAGWSDDTPVWTGSCPCQPFSSAGKRKGTADDRHLWPDLFRLVAECRPAIVFGEQVASKDGLHWLDGVFADLEGAGYAAAASDLCAAGVGPVEEKWVCYDDGAGGVDYVRERVVVGPPHIRQRLYWVADAGSRERCRRTDEFRPGSEDAAERREEAVHDQRCGSISRLDDSESEGRCWREAAGNEKSGRSSETIRLGDTDESRSQGRGVSDGGRAGEQSAWPPSSHADFWSDYQFIPCLDGKTRRIEPALSPLVDGISVGLGKLWAKCIRASRDEVDCYAENWGMRVDEVLRMVRECYDAEALSTEREVGVSSKFPPSPFLFDFLRNVSTARDRTAVGRSFPQAGAQDAEVGVRGVPGSGKLRRASSRRRSDEQQGREPANSVSELSRLLACSARTLWDAAVIENADAVPLSHWPVNRVALLRGYGNAIVPQVAAEFITAYREAVEAA